MASSEGRAPLPKRGDPNAKQICLELTPEEWRKLRIWAAEQDTSIAAIIAAVLRRDLEQRPRRTH